MQGSTNVLVFETPEQVAHAAAERFVEHAHDAISDHELFSVALAGGNTPRRMFELLASADFRSRIDWSRVHFFFGDERCVPANHLDSNYRLANDTLISHLTVPPANVHPIKGEGDPITNAQLYETELRSFFLGLQWPRLDCVLLGLGADGHTASLFPHTRALKEQKTWVVANWIEKLGSFRITLTAPAINRAVRIIFLVTGEEKAAALAAVLNGRPDPERLPAQLIQPEYGSLVWLVDRQAAFQLVRLNN